ncbi:hypothetical protein AAFF_G00075240 [Aldrovandia affinis]|uniref:Sulfotransferase n=1 Tax=Aldrovandia affinis TaxID=143900 RepID=A0AAD7WDX5_9TELE|nr:hypothetical protein AAFF_G00075240 [Aldrovandia affinis]
MGSPFLQKMHASLEKAKAMKEEDKLYRHQGTLYATIKCPPENLQALEKMEARPDDVLLVAYPKCGFSWMVGVLQKIMVAATGVEKEAKCDPLLEFLCPEMQKMVSECPSPRLLGTHLHPKNIPASFTAKKTKMLVMFRNPKDTAVSYFHFTNNNPFLPNAECWDKFYSEFMSGDVAWGSYFDHALAWEKRVDDPNVMIVTYECLKKNLPEGVRRVSKFFNFSLSEEQIQKIAQESTFKAMKECSKESHGKMGDVFFRKGEVGDWKNHFNDAQSKEMDAEFEKRLGGTKLGALLKYDKHCK